MSDAQAQVERVIKESEVPADGTQEEPLTADPKPDRTRQYTHTSFARVRTGWRGDDGMKVAELEALADQIVKDRFAAAFAVREKIRRTVRTQAFNAETGELLAYPDGTPVWKKDELGLPVEEWELLSPMTRERLLNTLVTYMFEWEIEAAKLWADAMYAKGIWEEVFAKGFMGVPSQQVSGKPTIDDKTQWGHINASEDRYFALFRSAVSRQADGILRAMKALQHHLQNTNVG